MAKVSVDDNENNVDHLLKTSRSLDDGGIHVGVLSQEDIDRSLSDMKMIATVHEFGATIDVTEKMRGFFWNKYYDTEDESWKWMALMDQETIVIPERRFLRSTLENHQKDIVNVITRQIMDIANGRLGEKQARSQIGEFVVSKMRGEIKNASPGLSDATVALREHGGQEPLRDTGQLWQSIAWERIG